MSECQTTEEEKEEKCPHYAICEKWRGSWYWGFCKQNFAWPNCPIFKGEINPSSRYLGMEILRCDESSLRRFIRGMKNDGN